MQEKELRQKIKALFPFEPYQIQLDFSVQLYLALSKKKLCIFESPTGTGKSLSLICGAFSWLKDNEDNYCLLKKINEEREQLKSYIVDPESTDIQPKQDSLGRCESNSLPEWMSCMNDVGETLFKQQRILKSQQLEEKKKRLKEFKQTRKEKVRLRFQEENKKKDPKDADIIDEDALCVDWQEEKQQNQESLAEQLAAYKKAKISVTKINQDDDDNTIETFKIIFASRTHSQLKQFTEEIKKTQFNEMRIVTLGSRQNLCLNSYVTDRSNLSLLQIDEYCQKAIGVNKTDKSVQKCHLYANLQLCKDDIEFLFLENIYTIDQMKEQAIKQQICPYFLAKQSVKDAQVICAPYAMVLDERAREGSNLDLKNAVIIFDESHNILETLSSIHSAHVSFKVLFNAFMQILTYYDRFCRKLNPKNALYIQTIKGLCFGLMKFVKSQSEDSIKSPDANSYIKINTISMLLALNMDRIDLFSLKKFAEETRLGQKLHFFSQSTRFEQSKIPPILLKLFTNPLKDLAELQDFKEPMAVERVLGFFWRLQESISKGEQYSLIIKDIIQITNSSVQILCLDVIEPLRKVLEESACVVLAGGTMQPLSEFELLINQIGNDRFENYSCEHVIADNNCAAFCVGSWKGQNLLFNYQNKSNDFLLEASVSIIKELAQVVPNGLVVFVQSYSFLEKLQNYLISNKYSLDAIQTFKKIFIDEKEGTNAVLEKYQKEIQSTIKGSAGGIDKKNGAILLSVIGGRLSEGINFSDELARCVVVLGMPYSNVKSPDLIEKMSHYDRVSKVKKCNFNGKEYYENICMKAVNQAIGRSIRHKNDYATILLVDSRFSIPKNVARLSGWIKKRVKNLERFEIAKQEVVSFFEAFNQ